MAKWWKRHGKSVEIKDIDFPSKLKNSYQKYTCANMKYLNVLNIDWKPRSTIKGIEDFLNKTNIVE